MSRLTFFDGRWWPSRAALAAHLGVSAGTVSKWATGRSRCAPGATKRGMKGKAMKDRDEIDARRTALHAQGLSDVQIARLECVDPSSIREWRKRRNMPPNQPRTFARREPSPQSRLTTAARAREQQRTRYAGMSEEERAELARKRLQASAAATKLMHATTPLPPRPEMLANDGPVLRRVRKLSEKGQWKHPLPKTEGEARIALAMVCRTDSVLPVEQSACP